MSQLHYTTRTQGTQPTTCDTNDADSGYEQSTTCELLLPKGYVTLVDASLADWLGQWKWQVSIPHPHRSYVNVYARRNSGRHSIPLHRAIYERVHGPIPTGMQIDHINRNSLDNRACNLRLVTPRQNLQNQRPKHEGRAASRYVGVHYEKRNTRRPWLALIRVNGKKHHLGQFATEQEAAQAYLDALERIGATPLPEIAASNGGAA